MNGWIDLAKMGLTLTFQGQTYFGVKSCHPTNVVSEETEIRIVWNVARVWPKMNQFKLQLIGPQLDYSSQMVDGELLTEKQTEWSKPHTWPLWQSEQVMGAVVFEADEACLIVRDWLNLTEANVHWCSWLAAAVSTTDAAVGDERAHV